MSEHSHAEIEVIARSVAKDEIKPVFERIEKLETNLVTQISALGQQYSHLKADIVEDVILKMKPVVGEMKDKAVNEAYSALINNVARLTNVNMGGNNADSQIEEFQEVLRFMKFLTRIKTKLILYGVALLGIIFALLFGGGGAATKGIIKFFGITP